MFAEPNVTYRHTEVARKLAAQYAPSEKLGRRSSGGVREDLIAMGGSPEPHYDKATLVAKARERAMLIDIESAADRKAAYEAPEYDRRIKATTTSDGAGCNGCYTRNEQPNGQHSKNITALHIGSVFVVRLCPICAAKVRSVLA